MVSCQAKSRPRAGGTRAGIPFRILTGIFLLVLLLVLVLGPTASITSTSTISLSTRTNEPTHRRVGSRSEPRRSDHVFALITEDLERFVEDRSKLRERSSSCERQDLHDPRPSALECSSGSIPNRCIPSVARAKLKTTYRTPATSTRL